MFRAQPSGTLLVLGMVSGLPTLDLELMLELDRYNSSGLRIAGGGIVAVYPLLLLLLLLPLLLLLHCGSFTCPAQLTTSSARCWSAH